MKTELDIFEEVGSDALHVCAAIKVMKPTRITKCTTCARPFDPRFFIHQGGMRCDEFQPTCLGCHRDPRCKSSGYAAKKRGEPEHVVRAISDAALERRLAKRSAKALAQSHLEDFVPPGNVNSVPPRIPKLPPDMVSERIAAIAQGQKHIEECVDEAVQRDRLAAELVAIAVTSNQQPETKPKRQSKGARVRAEKQAKAEGADESRRAQIQTQADSFDESTLTLASAGELMRDARKLRSSAASRCDNQVRVVTSRGKNLDVTLSDAELATLTAAAIASGAAIYRRPSGWVGMWPFGPSLDRLDVSKGYTFDNLVMVPWIENRARGADSSRILEVWARRRFPAAPSGGNVAEIPNEWLSKKGLRAKLDAIQRNRAQ